MRSKILECLHDFFYRNNDISNQTANELASFVLDYNTSLISRIWSSHEDAWNEEDINRSFIFFLAETKGNLSPNKRFSGMLRPTKIYFKDFSCFVECTLEYECHCCPPRIKSLSKLESY